MLCSATLVVGGSPAGTAHAAQRRWTVECYFTEPGAYLLVSPAQILWSDQEQPRIASLKDGTARATKSTMTISGIDPTGGEFRGVISKKPGNIGESD
jgi:hypothetical protein